MSTINQSFKLYTLHNATVHIPLPLTKKSCSSSSKTYNAFFISFMNLIYLVLRFSLVRMRVAQMFVGILGVFEREMVRNRSQVFTSKCCPSAICRRPRSSSSRYHEVNKNEVSRTINMPLEKIRKIGGGLESNQRLWVSGQLLL